MNRKVIIIGPAFPYRGGIANFNNSLAVEYKKQEADVRIYSFSLQYPSFLFPGKTQYENGNPPENIEILPVINSINPFNWFKVARSIRKENPDYVIIRYWIPFMAPALGTIAKFLGQTTKIFAITDNVIPHERRIGDSMLTKYFVSKCDAFLALSASVLDDLSKFTDTKEKIFIPHPIYNSFGEIVEKESAKQKIELDKDGKYLLFFGFVRKYKGLDIMLEVMADKRLQDLGVKLIVAGEFYDNKEEYISKIEELNISDYVILRTDFIQEEDVKNYFCASDIITQTYRTATQSGVTQIAYHFERPMLVTNVGGLAEYVDEGKSGYIVNSNNIHELEQKIVSFFNSDDLDEMPKYIESNKEKFSWEYHIEGILELVDGS